MNDILTISLYSFNNVYKKDRAMRRFYLDGKFVYPYNSNESYYYIERQQR